MYRQRAPRVAFSTLRFLRFAAERTARRRRLSEWLLLLLRSAAIFLLAVAMLAHRDSLSMTVGDSGQRAMVLVVDNSLSMAAESNGQSHYARARQHALDLLQSLGRGSVAAVVYAGGPSSGRVGEVLTGDLNRLADDLSSRDACMGSGDAAAAVVRAEQLLDAAPMDQREIVVLTDLNKATWRDMPDVSSVHAPPLMVVHCGAESTSNVAVSGVIADSVRPAVGVPQPIRVTLTNFDRAACDVTASFYVDRKKTAERTVTIPAAGTSEVLFHAVVSEAGAHSGWVDIDSRDALKADNRRYFSMDVPDRVRVAVVREREGALPLRDEAFFVMPALDPLRGEGASAVEPVQMLRSDLTKTPLSDYAALFLLDVPRLTTGEAKAISSFVRRGGGMIVFPGDETDIEAWNHLTVSDKGVDVPLLPAALAGANDAETAVTLARPDITHPMFAAMRDMPPRFFNALRIRRYHQLSVPSGSSARIPATLRTDHPFAVDGTVGHGRVLLFCLPATAAWSNLPSRTLFLPLIHQVTYAMARGHMANAEYRPGASVHFPVVEEAVEVTQPGGVVSVIRSSEGDSAPHFDHTWKQGAYAWRDTGDRTRSGVFVVNPDIAESDLSIWSEDEFEASIAGGRTVHFAGSGKEAVERLARIRKGGSLVGPLLLIVLALALGECFLANRTTSTGSMTLHKPLHQVVRRDSWAWRRVFNDCLIHSPTIRHSTPNGRYPPYPASGISKT